MADGSTDPGTVIDALQHPERLWTRAEVLERPSPVPPLPGIYGWHFTEPPADGQWRPPEWCAAGPVTGETSCRAAIA
jgi:hypothetical protein